MILELGIVGLASAVGAVVGIHRHQTAGTDHATDMRFQAFSEIRRIERNQMDAERQIFDLTESALDEMARVGGVSWK